jgi:hypothetical protein
MCNQSFRLGIIIFKRHLNKFNIKKNTWDTLCSLHECQLSDHNASLTPFFDRAMSQSLTYTLPLPLTLNHDVGNVVLGPLSKHDQSERAQRNGVT